MDELAQLDEQINYVKDSLGLGDGSSKRGAKGNGWSGGYELYCVACNFEITRPYIDPKDRKKTKKCPECKQANELWSPEDRKAQLQEHIDDLKAEEVTYKQRKKKWKKFRKVHPLILDDDQKELPYQEREMWIAKVDFDEYLDDPYFIPRSEKAVTDLAWKMHDKYLSCKRQMDKAVQYKQKGNTSLREGKYADAIKHYSASILHRTDYKASYTNRALAYMKLGKYKECIDDCQMVIDMIAMVDNDLDKSETQFKAYLRKANAYKMMNDYEQAKKICAIALEIRPNDGAAKKLLQESKREGRRVKLRCKLQKQMISDSSLDDFDSVLNLAIEFLSEATGTEEFSFETPHSEELLRRLLVFLMQNKKYCVRFADHNGIELSLKYLRKKFKIIKKWPEKMDTLSKPFLLLNCCCKQDVNFAFLKDKKLQKLIGIVVLYTFAYFGEMPKALQTDSMRFAAICVSIDHVRQYVSSSKGHKLVGYFVKFQKKTNPKEQDCRAIRCLFECINYLCHKQEFQDHLIKQSKPVFIYEVMFHSLLKYKESDVMEESTSKEIDIARGIDSMELANMAHERKEKLRDYEQLQFAISVIMDVLAIVFDGGKTNIDESERGKQLPNDENESKEKENAMKERETAKTLMFDSFLKNKNLSKYFQLICDYSHSMYVQFKKCEREIESKEKDKVNEKDTLRFFGQLLKCYNVLVSISKELRTHKIVFSEIAKYNDSQVFSDQESLMLFVRNNGSYKHRFSKVNPMIRAMKNNLLMFYDQLSSDGIRFDAQFSEPFDSDLDNAKCEKLPLFWRFFADVFCEEYTDRPNQQLMQQFGHLKSCSIRLMYRWMQRRAEATSDAKKTMNDNDLFGGSDEKKNVTKTGKKISFLMEMLIVQYFERFCDWLCCYNDLQIIANTPLVLRQCIIYAHNMRTERKHVFKAIKKALTLKRLKDVVRCMKLQHEVIQFNSCLLMDQINALDNELAATVEAMGALNLLQGFQRIQEERAKIQQSQQPINNAIEYK